jgi:hypothetical protein
MWARRASIDRCQCRSMDARQRHPQTTPNGSLMPCRGAAASRSWSPIAGIAAFGFTTLCRSDAAGQTLHPSTWSEAPRTCTRFRTPWRRPRATWGTQSSTGWSSTSPGRAEVTCRPITGCGTGGETSTRGRTRSPTRRASQSRGIESRGAHVFVALSAIGSPEPARHTTSSMPARASTGGVGERCGSSTGLSCALDPSALSHHGARTRSVGEARSGGGPEGATGCGDRDRRPVELRGWTHCARRSNPRR